MNYFFRFIFVFILLQFYVTLVHSKAGSYILPEAADVIDVTKAPFYADNSGKTDCYIALQKEETPLIRFLDDDFCNQAYFNGIRHITIEIGKNNPSAIAVDYVSSNNGELSDVDIICHDQQNPSLIGLNLPIRGGGLSFIHDIFIKGFKTGINVEGDYPGYTFENIRLERQLNEGIRHISKNIVIHNLTSINKCSAIRC